MPTRPPPPGSSVTTQRRGRSQAGPLDPWGQGRLHEHQPKLKCLFLLPCWLCSCPAPPPVTPACPWRALCTQRGPEAPGGHRELRGAASTQHVQTYAPYAHAPTGSGRRAPSGGALRSHPPARGGQFTFVMLCQRTSHPSGSRRPSSLAYRLVLVGDGGEAGSRGAGERSRAMLLPWAADTAAHARSRKAGRWADRPRPRRNGLRFQPKSSADTPPPRRPPRGLGWPGPQSEARRAGGKAWEPDGRRAGSPPKSGRLGWGRHPARKVLVDPPPVSGSREELGSSASGFLEPMLPACAGPSLGPAPRGQRGRRV